MYKDHSELSPPFHLKIPHNVEALELYSSEISLVTFRSLDINNLADNYMSMYVGAIVIYPVRAVNYTLHKCTDFPSLLMA